MNNFLQQVYWGNTVQDYLWVAGVILFVIILNRFISRVLANLLCRLFKKSWKSFDQKTFIELVVQPLGIFVVIVVCIIALYRLSFPDELNVTLYRYSLQSIFLSIGITIQIVAFIWVVLRIIDFIANFLDERARLTLDQSDNQLIVFFRDLLKVLMGIIGLLLILKFAFNYQIGSLLTGLSIVGAAIALALRESLENLIASFIIFFDKPFSMGDTVKVHSFTGVVEKIGLRSTRIRTDQKTFITVPNKQMVDSILDNLTLRTQRKAEIRLETGVNISSETLNKFIEAVKTKLVHPQIEDDTVFLSDIRSNSFLINIDFFTAPIAMKEFQKLKQQKNLEILKLMEEMKIELAGASSDIKISGKLDQ